MSERKEKRYCLEKLVHYDKKSGIETWIRTKLYSSDVEALSNFMPLSFRIFDLVSNKEIRRNVELNNW